eukprot:461434-Pelagomonas_calceolata.AAC.3
MSAFRHWDHPAPKALGTLPTTYLQTYQTPTLPSNANLHLSGLTSTCSPPHSLQNVSGSKSHTHLAPKGQPPTVRAVQRPQPTKRRLAHARQLPLC